jgi:hypothetical protein
MSLADNVHMGNLMAKTTKGIARATLSVSGGESKNLKKRRLRLSKLTGIRAVFVNYLTNMVYVEYDSGKITLDRIRRVLGLSPR